jgi:cellulose synthase/poly-beta-1,6-N-acetylglucosamine synthase-like glycosyltransferase
VIRRTTEPEGLTGKQAALDQAFQQVRGDVILLTDGDCVLPPSWVEEMLRHFEDASVGVVLGRVELPAGRNFLERFQAFEQPLLNQYNLGSAGVGLPTGCFGNNMALRARAMAGTGGFATLGFSVTEDALLLDAVARAGGWKVAVCSSEAAAALTRAQPCWKEYVDQHTRWNAGGLFSPDIVTRLSYVFIVLIYLVGSIVARAGAFTECLPQHRAPCRGKRSVSGKEEAAVFCTHPPPSLLLRIFLQLYHRAGLHPQAIRVEGRFVTTVTRRAQSPSSPSGESSPA